MVNQIVQQNPMSKKNLVSGETSALFICENKEDNWEEIEGF